MCRGIPGRVLTVDGPTGTADFFGTVRTIRLDLLEEPVAPGDHVLCSLGFAMRKVPPEDVDVLLSLYADVAPPGAI